MLEASALMGHQCWRNLLLRVVAVAACLLYAGQTRGQMLAHVEPLVPGAGIILNKVGDDFEDERWAYATNNPKSSNNIDKRTREPIGISANERVYESTYRGHPDVVRRVATPEGGIPGSRGSLFLQSRATGVPGNTSGKQQQDDLMINVYGILDREIGPQNQPSCTVRVFVPEWDKWEQRSGSSFGFRMDCEAFDTQRGGGFLAARYTKSWQSYWPGMFIVLNRAEDGYPQTHAQLLLRSGPDGQDIAGPAIVEPGWYTLGMSITPNGEVHYFACKGVGDLRDKDHLASDFPYGFRCEKFNLMFFNIVNIDDGRSKSTPWIIDDPTVYIMPNNWSLDQVARYKAKHSANQAAIAAADVQVRDVPASATAPIAAGTPDKPRLQDDQPEAVQATHIRRDVRPLPEKAFILRR